jgi:hypothetical protein
VGSGSVCEPSTWRSSSTSPGSRTRTSDPTGTHWSGATTSSTNPEPITGTGRVVNDRVARTALPQVPSLRAPTTIASPPVVARLPSRPLARPARSTTGSPWSWTIRTTQARSPPWAKKVETA